MIVIISDDNVEDLKSTLVTIKTGSIYAFISELLGGFVKASKSVLGFKGTVPYLNM